MRRPVDSAPRAYEWGYQATDVARSALGIAHDDPRGSEAFFDRFQLDPGAGRWKVRARKLLRFL